MEIKNVLDIIKILLSFSDKMDYKNLALVCKYWRIIINTLKKQEFLTWCPEILLPEQLTYICTDLPINKVTSKKVLLPKMQYESLAKFTDDYSIYITTTIKKFDMVIEVHQKIYYYRLPKNQQEPYKKLFVKTERCRFCSNTKDFYINDSCDCYKKPEYFRFEYEWSLNFIPVNLPIVTSAIVFIKVEDIGIVNFNNFDAVVAGLKNENQKKLLLSLAQ